MALIETFVDAVATADSAKWTYPANTGVTANQMTIAPVAAPAVTSNLSQARFDLTGSSIFLRLSPSTGGVGAITSFSLASPTAGSDLSIVIDNDAGTISFQVRTGYADANAAAHTIAYDPVAMAWLQFSHPVGGASVVFSTSPSGASGSYTQRRTPAVPGFGITSLQVAVSAFDTSGSPVSAKVSNVNTVSGGGVATGSKLASVQDTFLSLDTTKWAEQSPADVNQANGLLTINAAATGFPNLHALTTYDGSSSHILFKFSPQAGGVGTQAGVLLTSGTAGTRIRMQYLLDTNQIDCRSEVGSSDASHVLTTYNAATMAWWQLIDDGTNFHWQVSPTGADNTWVDLRSVASPAYLNAVTPSFSADATTTGSTSPATFSNLNAVTTGGGSSSNLPKATSLVDSFDTLISPTIWNNVGGVTDVSGAAVVPSGAYLQSIAQYDLTESQYICFVTPSDGVGDITSVVVLSGTAGTDLRFTFAGATAASTVGTLTASNNDSGSPATPNKSVSWDLAKGVWVRVVETGGQFTMSYSSDKASWSDLQKLGSPQWLTATRLLLGDNYVLGGPVTPPTSSTFTADTTGMPTGINVGIDFRPTARLYPTEPTDAYSIGSAIGGTTGLPWGGDTTYDNILKALGPLCWRLALSSWATGSTPVTRQGSKDAAAVAAWLTGTLGGVLYPLCLDSTNNNDNNIDSTKFSNLLKFFNDNGGQHGGPIDRAGIGNEPAHGNSAWAMSADAYATLFEQCYQAGQNLYPGVKLVGSNDGDISTYQDSFATSGNTTKAHIGGFSFHAYRGQDDRSGVYAYNEIIRLRKAYPQSGRLYGIEEFNFHSSYGGSNDQVGWYSWKNLVSTANVIGMTLQAGGHAYEFSDSGTIGMVADGTTNGQPGKYVRLPPYWGVAAFVGCTGLSTRARDIRGSYMVKTSTSTNDKATGAPTAPAGVQVYAGDNGKIILVCDSVADTSVTLGMAGALAGKYDLYQSVRNDTMQTAAYSQLVSQGTYSGGKITFTAPRGTVSVIDLFQ